MKRLLLSLSFILGLTGLSHAAANFGHGPNGDLVTFTTVTLLDISAATTTLSASTSTNKGRIDALNISTGVLKLDIAAINATTGSYAIRSAVSASTANLATAISTTGAALSDLLGVLGLDLPTFANAVAVYTSTGMLATAISTTGADFRSYAGAVNLATPTYANTSTVSGSTGVWISSGSQFIARSSSLSFVQGGVFQVVAFTTNTTIVIPVTAPSAPGGGSADNMGSHIATKTLDMGNFQITNSPQLANLDTSTGALTTRTNAIGVSTGIIKADIASINATTGTYAIGATVALSTRSILEGNATSYLNINFSTQTKNSGMVFMGSVTAGGFNMAPGAGNAKVLTSDGSGGGTWQTVSAPAAIVTLPLPQGATNYIQQSSVTTGGVFMVSSGTVINGLTVQTITHVGSDKRVRYQNGAPFHIIGSTFALSNSTSLTVVFTPAENLSVVFFTSGTIAATDLIIRFNQNRANSYATGRILAATATSSLTATGLLPFNTSSNQTRHFNMSITGATQSGFKVGDIQGTLSSVGVGVVPTQVNATILFTRPEAISSITVEPQPAGTTLKAGAYIDVYGQDR